MMLPRREIGLKYPNGLPSLTRYSVLGEVGVVHLLIELTAGHKLLNHNEPLRTLVKYCVICYKLSNY